MAEEARTKEVVAHLERAIEAAENTSMSTSELIGMFHYYAHNLAQQARENALREAAE